VRSAVAALLVAALAVASDLRAAPPPTTAAAPPTSPLSLRASPAFGNDGAEGEGWQEVVATVDNAGALPSKGTLEIQSVSPARPGSFLARAPFQVPPHAEAVIRVPVRGESYGGPGYSVTATGENGEKLAAVSVSLGGGPLSPLLVDLDAPSRLSVVMRGWPLSLAWTPTTSSYVPSAMTLAVGSPAIDATTGDLILPEHAAAYSAATVVVVPSERLARLQGPELDALVGWVLAGGTLAVFPTRPEDLRAGPLTTLAGGKVTRAPVPALMMTLPGAPRPPSAPPMPSSPSPPSRSIPPEEGAGATPIGFYLPARTTPFAAGTAAGPSATVRATLTGYSGGNLRPTEYGATAPYGLGQVHVLAFDPTSAAALEDAWVHGRLLDMIGDAWDRRSLLAMQNGNGGGAGPLYAVNRALDPNEGFRPAVGIAAILLVLYSIAVGPVTFRRARKRGRPLDPLVWTPVASAACFALIVLIGLAAKGWSGRARHLALVEAGAGMSRGSVRRFRGFFASETRALRVRASEPTSVLELATWDSSGSTPVLRLDKEGASLENVTSLPWQTVVVSEDGFAELGGGVAVREQADGSVVVSNHTGRPLRNVIVWAPKTGASYFSTVDVGATVASTAGRRVFTAASRGVATAGGRAVHELDMSAVRRSSEDMAAPWFAIRSAAGASTDWWPDDVPVVMGELRGGEGAKTDAGLRVESDVLLFRVIGEGGAT
jgi:hypothetical protein